MSYWHLLIILATAVVLAVALYVPLRWAKAPRVLKAMGFVATASLVAGVLVGFWSMHMLDTWKGSEVREAESTPAIRSDAPAASHASRVPVPAATPVVAGATPAAAPTAASGILASYIGQALAHGYVKNAAAGGVERWPKAFQGCRLGNYEATSAFCRAAALAVRGWGDTATITVTEIAEFCDAGYLDSAPALCWEAQHDSVDRRAGSAVAERASGGDVSGVPKADIAEELQGIWWPGDGPEGTPLAWSALEAPCATGAYAAASPMCEAEEIHEGKPDAIAPVPYSVVASFCDVGTIHRSSEVCRAAYRSLGVKGEPVAAGVNLSREAAMRERMLRARSAVRACLNRGSGS